MGNESEDLNRVNLEAVKRDVAELERRLELLIKQCDGHHKSARMAEDFREWTIMVEEGW